jgi:hypothetical protein
MSRGLARKRDTYYALLDAADSHRHGDLDGRGNLSEKLLWEWCEWFIALAADQVDFMTRMLDLDAMKARIAALITYRSILARKPLFRCITCFWPGPPRAANSSK